MTRQWRHCWSWSGIPGPGARVFMWTRPAMRRSVDGPSTKRAAGPQLNFDTCFSLVKGTPGEASPVRIGRPREDTCPHCGGRMVDMLVLDGRDERLRFLGLDGILTAACCPNCVGFLKGPAFNRFT